DRPDDHAHAEARRHQQGVRLDARRGEHPLGRHLLGGGKTCSVTSWSVQTTSSGLRNSTTPCSRKRLRSMTGDASRIAGTGLYSWLPLRSMASPQATATAARSVSIMTPRRKWTHGIGAASKPVV